MRRRLLTMLALLWMTAIAVTGTAHADVSDASPPTSAAARAAVRRWLRALDRSDLHAAEQQTALPFTIVTDGFLRRREDPAGQARTPAELRAQLALVRRSCVRDELATYLKPPSPKLSVVVRSHPGFTRVSFVHHPNSLADGTYVDAEIDVVRGASGRALVSRAKFVAFALN